MIESQIRKALRLPDKRRCVPGDRPIAPQFTAAVLDQKERFDLASTRGRPVLLLFFLHTCPHCHEALEFLKTALAELPEDKRPLLVGLELTGRSDAVRSQLRRRRARLLPGPLRRRQRSRPRTGRSRACPISCMIDRDGRIAHRMQGWAGEVDGPLLRMRMAKLAGAPVPMLLRAKGYSGSEACGVCHETEHETWELTKHARAFSTLVKHGADADGECVSCHVVGYGEEGGFDLDTKARELENVGCESCHGRGGPHLSPGAVANGDYQSACLGCHDTEALARLRVRDVPAAGLARGERAHPGAAEEERQKIMAERGALRTDLLPTAAPHVGSDACRSCHAKEYESWAASPHARALATLETKHKAGDANCLKCHTTGFGREAASRPEPPPRRTPISRASAASRAMARAAITSPRARRSARSSRSATSATRA